MMKIDDLPDGMIIRIVGDTFLQMDTFYKAVRIVQENGYLILEITEDTSVEVEQIYSFDDDGEITATAPRIVKAGTAEQTDPEFYRILEERREAKLRIFSNS